MMDEPHDDAHSKLVHALEEIRELLEEGTRPLPEEQSRSDERTACRGAGGNENEGGLMKDTVGASLREAWKQKGDLECIHQELSLERSFAGVPTGSYICTTCGAVISARSGAVSAQR